MTNQRRDFVDAFDRTNVDLAGDNGWNVVGDSAATVDVFETVASNSSTLGQAIAYQETSVPYTVNQEVSAYVASKVEGSKEIGIGLQGDRLSASPHWGLALILVYTNSSVRTLKIVEHATATFPAGYTELISLDVSNEVLKDPSNSSLNVLQHLKLSIEERPGGVLIQGWINPEARDNPDLVHFLNKDQLGLFFPFMFFDQGAATHDFAIGEFKARDIENEFDIRSRPDLYTVGDVLEMARNRYKAERNKGIKDLQQDVGTQFVRDAQAALINRCGDTAFFLNRSELMILVTETTTVNTFLLPQRMKNITSLTRETGNTEYPVRWRFLERLTDGRLRLRIMNGVATGANYRIGYAMRWADITSDSDYVAIPAAHIEALVLGVCLRYLELDNAPLTEEKLERRYEQQVKLLKNACNREGRMRGDRMFVSSRRRQSYHLYETELDHRGY